MGIFWPAYKALAPSLNLYTVYSTNPFELSKEDLIDYYIETYYTHRLKNLDVLKFLCQLNTKYGNNLIFLCHENVSEFCHRRLFADYISLTTGLIIPDISYNNELIYHEPIDYKVKLKSLMK